MYRTVIWATDGSEEAESALQEALRLTAPSGRIIAVHCDQRFVGRASEWPALADEEDRRVAIRERVQALQQDGVAIELVVRRTHREPATVVAQIAEEHAAGVIVCGSHGRGPLTGAALGSFSHHLLHEARCPVVVVPHRPTVAATRPEVVKTG